MTWLELRVLQAVGLVWDVKMAKVIQPIIDGKDFAKMTCDSVGMLFTAASELARASNNRAVAAGISNGNRIFSAPAKAMTPADINAANKKLHGYA